MEIVISGALKRLRAVYKDIGRQISAAEKLFIFQSAMLIESEAKKNVAKTAGKNVKIKGLRRTGNLMNSIGFEIKSQSRGAQAIIGPRNIKYGAMQEFGGIIRPRKAKRLFIPLSRKGQLLGPSRNKDNGLKFGKDFVLAKRAVRKGKPFMGPALNENVDKVLNLLSNLIDKQLK